MRRSLVKTRLGRVLTWNRGAERMYGYSSKEMVGRTLAALIPEGGHNEDQSAMERLNRGEAVNQFEATRLTKSGNLIHVLLTMSPIKEPDGTVLGMAQVTWDVTKIKQLERQLAQAQKLESIGQLAAGVAHEINTPIQYVGDNARFLGGAFADLIRMATPEQPVAASSHEESTPALAKPLEDDVLSYLRSEVPRSISHLIEGVEQVACIVRAMKEFSHLGPVEKTSVYINRAIESTIVVSRSEWKYVADLTTELAADLPPVPCVPGEFNQVILNLIVNAAHAIGDVIKNPEEKGSIHIRTSRAGDFAEIRVSDSGSGIPESIRSKVFDPFFTTKPVGKGTGQGLAIAHAVVVQKHHGVLRFESELGCGTTFVIQLPLACEMEPA